MEREMMRKREKKSEGEERGAGERKEREKGK